MSNLQFPVNLIDDGTGIEKSAYQAICACSNVEPDIDEEIGSDAFYVFWEPSNNHLHIQCFDCEQTYCPFQLCAPPATAESYQPKTFYED